jgi:hypothetical protein
MYSLGGRALDGCGLRERYQFQPNSEYPRELFGRHTVGANVHGEKGNNPNLHLRPPNYG